MPSTITSDLISHAYTYAWLGTAGASASTLSVDGIEARRNLCTNPSFEVDALGWSASGTTATTYAWTGAAGKSTSTMSVGGVVKRTNLAQYPSGQGGQVYAADATQSLTVTPGGARISFKAGSAGVGWMPMDTQMPDLPAGTSVSVSFDVYNDSSAIMYMQAALVGQVAFPSVSVQIQPYTWGRVSATGTTNARLTKGIGIRMPISMTVDGSALFRVAVIEVAESVGSYFDGDTANTTRGLDVLRTAVASHSGDASLQVRWRSQNQSYMYAASQFSGLQPDTDYMASLWVSIPTALSRPITLGVDTLGGSRPQNPVTIQEATPGWVRLVFPFRTLTDSIYAALWLRDDNVYEQGYVSQSMYIDDVLVETGGAALPYFDGSTLNYVEFENTLPLLVNGWEEGADSLSVVNRVIGGGFDVTLRDASPRQGAFELVYEIDDEEAAAAAFELHRKPTTFTISDSDRPSIAMQYVVNGRITRSMDEDRMYWIVRVEYQEV